MSENESTDPNAWLWSEAARLTAVTCGVCGYRYPESVSACPREAEHMAFNDLPVVLVRVTAVVSFDAYMVATRPDGTPNDAVRVGMNISDAVEYHAGRLGDTEDGDALVAVTTDVKVSVHHFDVIACQDTPEEVESCVEGMIANS